jgi:magnesium-transporting ATPase (P-type)
MSVVVKEGGSGKYLLLTKGADEAIFPRSCPGTWFSIMKLIDSFMLYFLFFYA